MSTFPELVGYLKRTASSAGFDMTVNTALVRKMVAAVEFAEAVRRHNDLIDSRQTGDIAAAQEACGAAEIAYRKATNR